MLSHTKQWLFNVRWQDGGDGTSGDSGTAAATGDAATAAGVSGQAAAAGYGFGGGMGSGSGANTGAPAGTSTTGTGSFGGGMGGGDAAAPGASATGTSVGMGPGSAASGSGGSPGVGPAGGVSTAATTSGGGGTAGGATGPGASTGGAATGGGGGTAAGGSGVSPGLTADVIAQLNAAFGASPNNALRGAVNLSQLDFGGGGTSTGVPSLGVPRGVGGQGAAPVGQVTVSPLGPPTPGVQTSLGTNDTGDQVSPPGTPNPFAFRGVPATNMGFPAAGLAHTPSGGYASSHNAPVGSTIGQSTVTGVPANMPAVGSHNAGGTAGGGGGLSGLAAAAQTAANQANPSVTSPNSPTAPMGGLLQTIISLVAGYPPLAQLAQQVLQG